MKRSRPKRGDIEDAPVDSKAKKIRSSVTPVEAAAPKRKASKAKESSVQPTDEAPTTVAGTPSGTLAMGIEDLPPPPPPTLERQLSIRSKGALLKFEHAGGANGSLADVLAAEDLLLKAKDMEPSMMPKFCNVCRIFHFTLSRRISHVSTSILLTFLSLLTLLTLLASTASTYYR